MVGASDLTGAWACQYGDGGTKTGSVALSAVGATTTYAPDICPNGPDCAPSTAQLFDSADLFNAPASTSYGNDFAACGLVRQDTAATAYIASHSAGGTSGWYFFLSSAGTPTLNVGNGSSATSLVGSASVTLRSWNFICFKYDDSGVDGTSSAAIFINGAEAGTSSALSSVNAPSAQLAIGGLDSTTPGFVGGMRGVFITEGLPDDGTIDGWARGALADDPTSSIGGSALEPTRASDQACDFDQLHPWTTILPPGRACVLGGAVKTSPAAINRVLNSETLGSWPTTVNTTVNTADAFVGRDGSMTAESLTSTVNGGYLQSTGFVGSGTTISGGVWVWTASGTQAVSVEVFSTTAAAQRCIQNATATTTPQLLNNCNGTTTGSNTHVLRLYPGGTAGTGTAIFWGGQAYTSRMLGPYSRTGGSQVATVADDNNLLFPVTPDDAEGCVAWRAQIPVVLAGTPGFVGPNGGATGLVWQSNTVARAWEDGFSNTNITFAASLASHTVDFLLTWTGGVNATLRGCDRTTAAACVETINSGAWDGMGWDAATHLAIGEFFGANHANFPVGRIKFGLTPTACGVLQ